MEKGLWRYEANVAEPSDLNAAWLAQCLLGDGGGRTELLRYYTANRKHNRLFRGRPLEDDTGRFITFVVITPMFGSWMQLVLTNGHRLSSLYQVILFNTALVLNTKGNG